MCACVCVWDIPSTPPPNGQNKNYSACLMEDPGQLSLCFPRASCHFAERRPSLRGSEARAVITKGRETFCCGKAAKRRGRCIQSLATFMNLIYALLNKIYAPAANASLPLRSSQLSVWLIRRVLGESAAARWLATFPKQHAGRGCRPPPKKKKQDERIKAPAGINRRALLPVTNVLTGATDSV